jgi:hypothetical protein
MLAVAIARTMSKMKVSLAERVEEVAFELYISESIAPRVAGRTTG